mgnify:CR=1 FL=1|jgi:hypothetical protein
MSYLNYSYIIGSGWYSCENPTEQVDIITEIHQQKYGGKTCRTSDFSKLWLINILKYCEKLPSKIIITDSNSPDKINDFVSTNELVEIIKLTKNFGHGVYSIKNNILCGWARSVLVGAMYALLNDVDYYVYLEQDLLVFGKNWLDKMILNMIKNKKNISLYDGRETPHKLQQSLIIISKHFLQIFISKLINYQNNKVSEEHKYWDCFENDITWIPFKGGRQRKKLDKIYYSKQHMSEEELEMEIKKHNHLQIQ